MKEKNLHCFVYCQFKEIRLSFCHMGSLSAPCTTMSQRINAYLPINEHTHIPTDRHRQTDRNTDRQTQILHNLYA